MSNVGTSVIEGFLQINGLFNGSGVAIYPTVQKQVFGSVTVQGNTSITHGLTVASGGFVNIRVASAIAYMQIAGTAVNISATYVTNGNPATGVVDYHIFGY